MHSSSTFSKPSFTQALGLSHPFPFPQNRLFPIRFPTSITSSFSELQEVKKPNSPNTCLGDFWLANSFIFSCLDRKKAVTLGHSRNGTVSRIGSPTMTTWFGHCPSMSVGSLSWLFFSTVRSLVWPLLLMPAGKLAHLIRILSPIQ